MSDVSIPTNLASEDIPFGRFSRRTRISSSQFGLMVDYMTLNPEIVLGGTASKPTKALYHKKWEELSSLLNADGTGAKRGPDRWRKAWNDQKNYLKSKLAKIDAYRTLTGSDAPYKLSDLEERVLKLMKYNPADGQKKVVSHNVSKNHAMQTDPVEISPASYIVLNVGNANVPVLIESSNHSSSELDPPSVFVAPENIVSTELESSSDALVRIEKTNDISKSSASKSDLNGSQSAYDIKPSLETTADTQETQTKITEKSRVYENRASLIAKPCEVSLSSGISSCSEVNQEPLVPEKTVESVMSCSIQNSSSNRCMKKFKVSHQPHFQRKNDSGIAKLLQRQNKLLEGIAGTLARIEKSVNDRSSLEIQRKNNMLVNISENIEKLAESLGTVSKSLKSIADN